jgi:hypothetical protein
MDGFTEEKTERPADNAPAVVVSGGEWGYSGVGGQRKAERDGIIIDDSTDNGEAIIGNCREQRADGSTGIDISVGAAWECNTDNSLHYIPLN